MSSKENMEWDEELEACRQIIELDRAVLAAVLEVTGPVTVELGAVKRCLLEKTEVRGGITGEGGAILWTDGKV